MHNVTADQIEKNKQLIALVKQYPQIYNHDPTQQTGETVEEIWAKIGQQMGEPADVCKKKWRLLRSSLIRYIKVFKDKSTSKGNRYRPYYLLEHMDFLLPFIDDKMIIRKIKPVIKTQQSQPATTTTVTLVKKDRDDETILYANTTPNTITYNVVATTSKDSSSQELKAETQQTQDIQQYYNAGVKIIGEDYITTYQPGEQLIYQASASADEQQIHQEQCIQEQEQHQECLQQESPSKAQIQGTTIIPIPNMNSVFSSSNPSEASDLYFLIGLLPDFKNLNHDQKRKVKIGILKLIDDAVSI
ncbi:hypothetical protein PVAND_006188 [Polypedilum vanderplanki]|uniref:MADF domain-containing protein n=1 Tax=Polypedilum vanderplanki TaxID=319348 RepID=A0A9J6C2V1_POLVA|nr:hypothetical protein PVAND_006188 [Polypedilum vanderplanki]